MIFNVDGKSVIDMVCDICKKPLISNGELLKCHIRNDSKYHIHCIGSGE